VSAVNAFLDDEHDPETGALWWARLPGMTPPGHGLGPDLPVTLANQFIALVCVMRIRPVLRKAAGGSDGLRRCAAGVEMYRRWLDEATDAQDAWMRRVLLCEVTSALPASGEFKHAIEYLKYFAN